MKAPIVLTVVAGLVVVAAVGLYLVDRASQASGKADPDDAEQVARGAVVYADYCASCHGSRLEGEPDWQERNPEGRLPAPPHDETGHTWHHPDEVLFELTKYGPQRFAGPDYPSDMPAFEGQLSDQQIWDSLAYIMNKWPDNIRARQESIDARAANNEGQ